MLGIELVKEPEQLESRSPLPRRRSQKAGDTAPPGKTPNPGHGLRIDAGGHALHHVFLTSFHTRAQRRAKPMIGFIVLILPIE
ncbi:MAG TPA: hypothetical protein VHT91_19740 [Kofleriaceae bacterium]|jgi:hypothetical protein|nr:hypothetical protein [Kofleriaceae bacterium]